jgi:DNA-binding LacI/PurR family transcriptional regulator
VSRVLNQAGSVTPHTRQRVELAIDQLGYRRNTAARALVTRRSHMLGVISVDTSNYGPARTLFAIEEAARAQEYFVNFVSLRQVTSEAMRAAMRHLMAANVDGVVVIAPIVTAVEAVSGAVTDVPLVSVASRHDEAAMDRVGVNQAGGAAVATQYLLSLGHRTVHHVMGPVGWFDAEAREQGWRETLTAAGAGVPQLLLGDWSPESGYEAGRRLAAMPDVTAVFVANDQMALGVVRALHEAGLRVPEDISLVGFDDIPESAHFLPPLTTMRQDFATLGRLCIERLMGLIERNDHADAVAIDTTMVVRQSAAPPRR